MPPPVAKGQSVTHVSGIRCYLCLRKDSQQLPAIGSLPLVSTVGDFVGTLERLGDLVGDRKSEGQSASVHVPRSVRGRIARGCDRPGVEGLHRLTVCGIAKVGIPLRHARRGRGAPPHERCHDAERNTSLEQASDAGMPQIVHSTAHARGRACRRLCHLPRRDRRRGRGIEDLRDLVVSAEAHFLAREHVVRWLPVRAVCRIEPMTRSTWAFGHGERGAVRTACVFVPAIVAAPSAKTESRS